MILTLKLALRDLFFERGMLICNVALIFGIILPLLVLQAAKTGLYQNMLNDLTKDPNVLRIDTTGNVTFTQNDVDAVRALPGVSFVVGMPRAFSDVVRLRNPSTRAVGDAVALTSGVGDPYRGPSADLLTSDTIAITQKIAELLGLSVGDPIDLVSDVENRPRQIKITLQVIQIIPEDIFVGRTVLVLPAVVDVFEAFIDNYALPDFGITEGKPLSQRTERYERLRVHAASLDDVGRVQARIEKQFQVFTRADTVRIQSTMQLGRALTQAMTILSIAALSGLMAALGFSFWAEVNRKRRLLSTLALLGLRSNALLLYPVTQAAVCATLGLAASFLALAVVGPISQSLFKSLAMEDVGLSLPFVNGLIIWIGVTVLVIATAFVSAVRVRSFDPATVLREV